MTRDALLGLATGGACIFCLALGWAVRARRASRQVESLIKPIHELRGALGALDLGLATMQRATPSRLGLDASVTALRAPLERARLAVADLDACLLGRPAASATGAEPIELASIVLQCARSWSRLAPSYSSRFRIDWRAGPVLVRGNGGRLKQALDNLIANALEHGGGRVLVESDVQAGCVRVAISDGGPGPSRIGVKRRKRSACSPRGHGLSIAKDIVEAHGGKLLHGTGGNGAAIVVELPVEGQLDARVHARSRQRLSSIAAPVPPDSRAPNAA